MFGLGLSSGLRALAAARLNIQTVGHNVANANTPGFSRQRVMQSATLPFLSAGRLQIGTGVAIDDVARMFDDGLERRLRLQLGMQSMADVHFRRFEELEGILNEPDGGLSASFGDFFGRIGKLQTNPADRALRGGVIEAGKALAQGFNLIAGRIGELDQSAFTELRGAVRTANEHFAAIAQLNVQIVSMEANGSTANDLRDQRELHVKEIATLIGGRALERSNGSVDVLVDGHVAVAGDRVTKLAVSSDATGAPAVVLAAGNRALAPREGRIGALLAGDGAASRTALSRLDALAYNLALEFNRLHTTGVPLGGPFRTLASHHFAADGDGDGQRGDELLAQAGLPFPVQAGEVFVTVTDTKTGGLERTRIAIDPNSMTLQQLADRLDAIDHLDATVEPTGRLKITAQPGYGFDFGNRLDAAPDTFGSFAGTAPSFATAKAGPFDLSSSLPASFTVTVDGTARAVSLAASEFANPSAATVDELVKALNADLAGAATARNVGGRLVVRSNSSGAGATLSLVDGAGSPLAALGLPAGVTRNGQAGAVKVQIAGRYDGPANGRLVFVASGDGQIGVTPGLKVDVFDADGNKVATLDVGRDYSPGKALEVADGVTVAFGPGTVSASANDVFALDTLADSDTSDVLVALGLNSFFIGSTAADLTVDPELLANTDRLAAGLGTAPGDASNLERFITLRTSALGLLDGLSFEQHYESTVADIGFETASAKATLQSQEQLLAHIQAQREAVSGVNVDEEMVDLVRHQQAFEAASRFINVIGELTRSVINIGGS